MLALLGCCVGGAAIAAPVAAARDATVSSFDGTPLAVHFFPAADLRSGQRAPTVLVGSFWGLPAVTDPNSGTDPLTGVIGLGPLRRAGYNVVTWDPRGFGRSDGTIEVDSPQFEGRDVSALIDFVARQPEAQLDGPGDPRVGMAGGSYGGGVQFIAAAEDKRIDAIVPDIAWHSLLSSLDKSGALKTGWAGLLLDLAAGRPLDPHVTSAAEEARTGAALSDANRAFFASRGPGSAIASVHVPTLLIQGTVDGLFTLQEAVTNYHILRTYGVPVKMLWFCGGHGDCDFPRGDTRRIQTDTLSWLARYLKQDPHVATGSGFEWVDQAGRDYSTGSYPPQAGRALRAAGGGTLRLVAAGGAGPLQDPHPRGPGIVAADVSPAPARNAVDLVVRNTRRRAVEIVGAPFLSLVYRGHARRRSVHVLAQLVDNATGKVLGNQITPIPLVLDGRRHHTALPLEIIAANAKPGASFTLQLVAQSAAYNLRPRGGSVDFLGVRIRLPTLR